MTTAQRKAFLRASDNKRRDLILAEMEKRGGLYPFMAARGGEEKLTIKAYEALLAMPHGNAIVPESNPLGNAQLFVDGAMIVASFPHPILWVTADDDIPSALGIQSLVVSVPNYSSEMTLNGEEIENLNFHGLKTLSGNINLEDNPLGNADFPELTDFTGSLNLGTSTLGTLTAPKLKVFNGTLAMQSANISQANLDAFLNSLAETLTEASGTLDASVTNATPGAASATARATLATLGLETAFAS